MEDIKRSRRINKGNRENIWKITRVQVQGCQVQQFIHNMEPIIDFAQVNGAPAKVF